MRLCAQMCGARLGHNELWNCKQYAQHISMSMKLVTKRARLSITWHLFEGQQYSKHGEMSDNACALGGKPR
jgi:hypothetical protein